jgi:hypothetical protein
MRIGQKVVCADARRRNDGRRYACDGELLPQEGCVYTIRAIVPCKGLGYEQDGLLLEEVVNPVRRYVSPSGPVTSELMFRASRFRPVRSTKIDVFLAMLEPSKADRECCDA